MKIDKLGFYRRADGDEVEIVFISKKGEYDFIAMGKHYYNKEFFTFTAYKEEDGEYEYDERYNLIEYLRPSGVEWPTPRKTSFVAYINESYVDNFDLKDPDCVICGIHSEPENTRPGMKPRKISKWRFYGEELLGE